MNYSWKYGPGFQLVRLWAIAMALPGICQGCAQSDPASEEPADPVTIRTDFEGSNLATWSVAGDSLIQVSIRPDTNSPGYRWYSFIVENGTDRNLTFRIMNAGGSNAAPAWAYNQPAVSADDGRAWTRITDTAYDGVNFTFRYTPPVNSAWIAYQPVYNLSRWLDMADEIKDNAYVDTLYVLASSREGNPLHLVKVTDSSVDDSLKSAVWIVARQHPAEVGGSYMAEGLLRWAIGDSPAAQTFRRRSMLYMIPFMNPDGVLHGNYRVNGAGVNLNRVWDDPALETEPTVASAVAVMERFRDDGGDIRLFADFHAHSTYRKNFFYYASEESDPELHRQMTQFIYRFSSINPDFTFDESVETSPGNPGIAWAWAYLTFRTHAVTFESSYQDITYGPNAGEYMTVDRLLALGEAFGRATAGYFYGAD